ncbi:flagellar hook-associated protein FlgK [Candidatus Cyrtobacter comes]|uniref:Flagellar hook-associated protein 1 n=1 Tax=Candidatus Cyrtobacter comes TaxID=675776 RepID=A0ABU5L7I9_9RICK|nr:hypothetical protein [Candidatus Cyrtobacter comes]MDZ5762090.1 flagellar hook-associated protein FlgK [Candidatus Cyrtobacter comes]
MNTGIIYKGPNLPVDIDYDLEISEQVISERNHCIAKTHENSEREKVASSIQNIMGRIGDGGYAVDHFQNVMNSIQNITSNSKIQRIDAINSLKELVQFFGNANTGFNELDSDLDKKISDSIFHVNGILDNIREANNSLRGEKPGTKKSEIQAAILGQLATLSEYIDIEFSFDADGLIQLNGASTGMLLANGDTSSFLKYVTSDEDIMSTGFSKGAIVLSRKDSAGYEIFGGAQVVHLPDNSNSKMEAGSISGLIKAKNEDLYSHQRWINATFNSFLATINKLHNNFMPQNGVEILSGQRELTLQSVIPNSGILQIGIMPDESTSPMEAYMKNLEIDLASLKGKNGKDANVQSLIDAVSSLYNPSGHSLSIGQFLDVKMLINTPEITQGNKVKFGFELNLGDEFQDGTKFFIESFILKDGIGNEIFKDQNTKSYAASLSRTKQQEAIGLEYEASIPSGTLAFPLRAEVKMLSENSEATVIYEIGNDGSTLINGLLNKKLSIEEVVNKKGNVYDENLSQELFLSLKNRHGAEISDPLDNGFLEIASKDGLKFVMTHKVDDSHESLMNFFGLNDLFLSYSRDRSIFDSDSDISKLFQVHSSAVDHLSLGNVKGGLVDGKGEGYYVAGGSIDAIHRYTETIGLFRSKFVDFTLDVERHYNKYSNNTKFEDQKFQAIDKIHQDIHKNPLEEYLRKLHEITTLMQAMSHIIKQTQDLERNLIDEFRR